MNNPTSGNTESDITESTLSPDSRGRNIFESPNDGNESINTIDDGMQWSTTEFTTTPIKSRSVSIARALQLQGFIFRHKNFVRECFNAHNKCRRAHNAPPLTLNRRLCEVSLEWAEYLCALGRLRRRRRPNGLTGDEDYEQNLFMAWPTCFHFIVRGSDPVDFWYNGVKAYAFGADPRNTIALPFAQIVWRETTSFGAAISLNGDGKIFAVASYSPPGNIISHYAQNVLPRPGALCLTADDVAAEEEQLYSEKQREGLRLHNELRSRHGVPSLSLDPYLIRAAMEWARRLCEEERLAYRIEYSLGENIYAYDPTSGCSGGGGGLGALAGITNLISGWGGGASLVGRVGIRSALAAWYNEIDYYEFGTEPQDIKARNFTQLIWRTTRRVGMALAYGQRGRVVCVANYYPRGNVTGRYAENVPPPCGRPLHFSTVIPPMATEKTSGAPQVQPAARSVVSKTSRATATTNVDEVDIPLKPRRAKESEEMSEIIW